MPRARLVVRGPAPVKRALALLMLIAAAGFAAWVAHERTQHAGDAPRRAGGGERVAPVQVAAVERGAIESRRVFAGTLTAHAEFVVAPKVSGRIERLDVDLGDTVTRGQAVAKLDDAEFVQEVAQARADIAVAEANLAEARAQLGIAERELARVERLRERGVASESQLDTARADQVARAAHVEVTRAQVTRAQAALESARIRLGYTEVSAGWSGGSDRRVVAERYVDEGETVAANAPLVRIVELDPVTAVFFVTERDYALLAQGQATELTTDAFPGERFPGAIRRIAPVFRESTRQAQVEVRVDNADGRLKPGLFVRVEVVLEAVADAVIVPAQALVRREGGTGVFTLSADRASVAWRALEIGIEDGVRAQVTRGDPGAEVVVLGQQLLDDGSAVVVGGDAARAGR